MAKDFSPFVMALQLDDRIELLKLLVQVIPERELFDTLTDALTGEQRSELVYEWGGI